MRFIAGVDEVGRGPLAGPVVAAAVVFREGYINPEIKDSKKLSAKKRDSLIEVIKRDCVDYAIFAIGPRTIDQMNILQAARLAMSHAVKKIFADLVLVDGNVRIDCHYLQETVVGGDGKHVEIAAASILAKVWRDRLMTELDHYFPGYGLSQHAGYPTPQHLSAISALGPSPIHRFSFGGVKEHVAAKPMGALPGYPFQEIQEVSI